MPVIYRQGTVHLSAGSRLVNGIGTNFKAYIRPGAKLYAAGQGPFLIDQVNDRRGFSLADPWPGATGEYRYRIESTLDSEYEMLQVRHNLKKQVEAHFIRLLKDGFEFEGHTFQADETKSQPRVTHWLAHLAAGLPLPEDFSWRDINNEDVPMDADTFKRFAASLRAYVDDVTRGLFASKTEIDSHPDPSSLTLELILA